MRNSPLRLECLEDRRLLSATTATTTTLAALPPTSQYSQPVVLQAQVTTSPKSHAGSGPSGLVTFYLGSPTATSPDVLGTATLNQRGVATLDQESSPLPVGATDTLYAVYSGDSTFITSQSVGATETVNPASTHTMVTASPNPGVAGANVTFTAIVSDAAPNWQNNGGTITPPTGTVTFTVNGTAVSAASVTFVGDSGENAIYTYATAASSLTATPNTITATYTGDANYQDSSSQTLKYQVVSAANAGSGTITAGSSSSPVTLTGGQQLSVNYSSTGTAASNLVTYTNISNGIALTSTAINSVVFSSNGDEAEISGTGTNGSGSTPVNFTLFVSTNSSGKSIVSISIVGSTPVTSTSGAGFEYNQSGSLASGSTATISETGSTAAIPANGGLPSANDHVLGSWPGHGHGHRHGHGFDSGGSRSGGGHFEGHDHGRRR